MATVLERRSNHGVITISVRLTGATDSYSQDWPEEFFLLEVDVKPGTGGAQPTDEFDLTLTDDFGPDLLNGQGADLTNATNTLITQAALGNGTLVHGGFTLSGGNIGDANTVDVTLKGVRYVA